MLNLIKRGNRQKLLVLFVLVLLVNLPLVSALEISNVRAEEISDRSAVVKWQTDEAGGSFLHYGTERENLETAGDARDVTEHLMPLLELSSETTYYYSVESEGVVDDKAGEYYSFTTLARDTTPPPLTVSLPTAVKGTTVEISGTTEIGVVVQVLVNGVLAAVQLTESNEFVFSLVVIKGDQSNQIKVEAEDPAGNKVSWEGIVVSDASPPRLELEEVPELASQATLELKGTLSEQCGVEIFVNGRSVTQFTGDKIEHTVSLEEGENTLKLIIVDGAGWQTEEEVVIKADTQPPTVRFELVGGSEYYEGRAETDIVGETEPGAAVYLYIYREKGDEYKADFKQALTKVTADGEGKFTFSEVSFPPPPITGLEELMPREVPSGLENILIPRLPDLADRDRKTYYVYVVAEDRTGKTGFNKETVHVNTCYSANFAFNIYTHPNFPPQPFRLDPLLMEEGREKIVAAFKLDYKGGGAELTDAVSGEREKAYDVTGNPRIEPACTTQNAQSDDYNKGCKLLPRTSGGYQIRMDYDETLFTFTSRLQRTSDFADEGFEEWKEFADEHLLKFPLKISVSYKERNPDGSWSEPKTQVMCYDLGYFVDVSVSSSDLVPDAIIDEGVPFLNKTISLMDEAKRYLQYAYMAAGVACMVSNGLKFAATIYRKIISKYEFWYDKVKEKDKDKPKCPLPEKQNEYCLRSYINGFRSANPGGIGSVPSCMSGEGLVLDEVCEDTAKAWETEAKADQISRWACDRFLCRSVPARWTEEAKEAEIDQVILEQKQCMASTDCVDSMRVIERCRDHLTKASEINLDLLKVEEIPGDVCYLDEGGTYYRRCIAEDGIKCLNPATASQTFNVLESKNLWLLTPVHPLNTHKGATLFYVPFNSNKPCLPKIKDCEYFCRRTKGYEAVKDGVKPVTPYVTFQQKYLESMGRAIFGLGSAEPAAEATGGGAIAGGTEAPALTSSGGPCYQEEAGPGGKIELNPPSSTSPAGEEGKIRLGYTKDCYVDQTTGEKYQCVCQKITDDKPLVPPNQVAQPGEVWSYRQDAIFRSTKGKLGRYYDENRYFQLRDQSGAFGQNWAFGMTDKEGEHKTHEINPKASTLAAFQTLCLTEIYARLQLWQSVLLGIQNCLLQAKYTGDFDAGLCKTVFTQQVCGLIYRLISWLSSDCSPLTFNDLEKEKDGEEESSLGALLTATREGIAEGLQESVNSLMATYDNAHLENFFASGMKGFTQSVCLGVIQWEFPFGLDFVQDMAYSAPMESSAFVYADRELSSFDPVNGNAVHKYTIAGSVLPGCNIRGYQASLKCVGPEDLGHPDVECGGRECDCLAATSSDSGRVHSLGGDFRGMERRELFNLPIESPQPISSAYRYDHIVLELFLEPGESPESCFPEGRRTANGGKFYFPIFPVEVPSPIQCTVNFETGKFVCPEVLTLFTGGKTYLEHPFVRCWDKKTDEFVDCKNTANLFLKGDEVVIKPQLFLGEEPACLKITETNNKIKDNERLIPLPDNLYGSYPLRIDLGEVDENMFKGTGIGHIVMGEDNPDCAAPLPRVTPPEEEITSTTFKFEYWKKSEGYQVQLITPDHKLEVWDYDRAKNEDYDFDASNYLTITRNGERTNLLTLEEVNRAVFKYGGYEFYTLLNNPRQNRGYCTFQLVSRVRTAQENTGYLNLKLELFKQDESGCTGAPVRQTSIGKTSLTQMVRVQRERMEVTEAREIKKDFDKGEYDEVISKARSVIELNPAEKDPLEEAEMIYFAVAAYVMKGAETSPTDEKSWLTYKSEIMEMLDLFFKQRDYSTRTGDEFKKLTKYLCEVDKKLKENDNSYERKCDEEKIGQICGGYNIRPSDDPYAYRCSGVGEYDACNLNDPAYEVGKEFKNLKISALKSNPAKANHRVVTICQN